MLSMKHLRINNERVRGASDPRNLSFVGFRNTEGQVSMDNEDS